MVKPSHWLSLDNRWRPASFWNTWTSNCFISHKKKVCLDWCHSESATYWSSTDIFIDSDFKAIWTSHWISASVKCHKCKLPSSPGTCHMSMSYVLITQTCSVLPINSTPAPVCFNSFWPSQICAVVPLTSSIASTFSQTNITQLLSTISIKSSWVQLWLEWCSRVWETVIARIQRPWCQCWQFFQGQKKVHWWLSALCCWSFCKFKPWYCQ